MSRAGARLILGVAATVAALAPTGVLANPGETLSLLTSAREAALGGPAALDGSETGLTSNPAASTGRRPMVSATYAQWLGDARVAQCSAAASSSLGRAGVMVGALDAGSMRAVDGAGASRTLRAQQDLAASATFSRNVTDRFAVGVAGTWMRSTLLESTHAEFALADAGARWTSGDGRLAIGASVLHVGTPLGGSDAASVAISPVQGGGVAWQAIRGAFGTLTGTLDYRTSRRTGSQGIVGAELVLRDVLWLRGATVATGPERSMSAGAGFRLRKLQFDYALVAAAGLASASRSSLTFTF